MLARTSIRLISVVAVVIGTACDGFLTPRSGDEVEDGRLTVIRVAPDAPALDTTEVSFWMVRGQEHVVEIRYEMPGYDGKCLRLVIPAEAPLRHANGESIAPGDSVHVTVRVVDASQFLFELEPIGLTLNPSHPAVLEVRYRWLAEDANGDGRVDGEDQRVVGAFGLWAQDPISSRWTRLPATRDAGQDEIRAPINVFTRYALASD